MARGLSDDARRFIQAEVIVASVQWGPARAIRRAPVPGHGTGDGCSAHLKAAGIGLGAGAVWAVGNTGMLSRRAGLLPVPDLYPSTLEKKPCPLPLPLLWVPLR